jgi:F-type H+-transporting ATPase subunit b
MAVLIAELVAFVVILYVLYRFVRPIVATMVRDRQDAIQQHVDASEEAERKLEQAQRRFETAEAEARKEVARIRDDARADASRIKEELQEQADREIERIRQRGEEQLAAQREQLIRGLRSELGGTSMQLAERIVVQQLADDRAKSVTVDQFLNDLDGMSPRSNSQVADADRREETPVAVSGGGAN